MKHGRTGHLVRTVILLVAIAVAFIVVSAAIRYNRNSGLFDSHKHKPAKQETPALKTVKPAAKPASPRTNRHENP